MSATGTSQTPSGPLLPAAARAAAIAVVVNTALYVVARLVGAYPSDTISTGAGASGAPSLIAIVAISALASVTAVGLFSLLIRYVPRPGVVFMVIATSVFAGFVVGPLSLNASLGTTVTLELMHLVVAMPIVVELMRALGPRSLVTEGRERVPSEATA